MSESKTTDPMVAALLRERDSYQRQDLPDRIAQVEEQLRLRGWVAPKPPAHQPPAAETPAETPAEDPAADAVDKTPPRGRRGGPRSTA